MRRPEYGTSLAVIALAAVLSGQATHGAHAQAGPAVDNSWQPQTLAPTRFEPQVHAAPASAEAADETATDTQATTQVDAPAVAPVAPVEAGPPAADPPLPSTDGTGNAEEVATPDGAAATSPPSAAAPPEENTPSATEASEPATEQPPIAEPMRPDAEGVHAPPGDEMAIGSLYDALTTRAAHDPGDLSPWRMFLAADVVVKAVMISLVVASALSWTIWIAKLIGLAFANATVGRDARRLEEADDLKDAVAALGQSRSPAAVMARLAAQEVRRSDAGALPSHGIKERVASLTGRVEVAAGRRIAAGTAVLASVGSVGPFVGLFGTVWGIMNSFVGIAKSNTTNLAVVAPGIAEALLATGIGLVAAIPAVLFYNQLAKAIAGYKARVGDAAAIVERMVSRDLDRAAVHRGQPVRAAAE